MSGFDDGLIDGVGFARDGSALRASSRANPRDRPCPTCEAPDVLTRADEARHYQCDSCADAAEAGRAVSAALELFPEEPLVFIPTCARCGARGEPVPVEDNNWNAAEKWCYLASKAHDEEMHPERAVD